MFKVGQVVWVVNPLIHKPSKTVINIQTTKYRVLSADFDTAAVLPAEESDSILEMFHVRFIPVSDCFEKWEHAKEIADDLAGMQKRVEAILALAEGEAGTEPSPIGETGPKSDPENEEAGDQTVDREEEGGRPLS
jgi:hypothetical protein